MTATLPKRTRVKNETVMIREAVITYGASTPIDDLNLRSGDPITSSISARAILSRILPHAPQERFVVLALDARIRPTGWMTVGVGTAKECLVDTAAVCRFLALSTAAAFIVAHNHPSGDPSPSRPDHHLTERLAQLGSLMGVGLLDHIILGDGDRHFSFCDAGLIDAMKQA